MGSTALPQPCGPLSEAVLRALTASPQQRSLRTTPEAQAIPDPIFDRDFQLALWMLYELHYDGFEGVDDALEWDPLLLAARGALEMRHERSVRSLVELPDPLPTSAGEVTTTLLRMTISEAEPVLAAFLARQATEEQFRSYLAERAVYHLRESDAQCFLLPRLRGAAQTALAEILDDEFGAGRADRLHADLFARALSEVGMPTDITTYVDQADATMLASVNTTSLFNLHRRLRGAAAGHFAAFEATSSVPCRLIAAGADRLGLPAGVADYYNEHVEADAVHEQVAINDLCGALLATEPALLEDVLLGAGACLAVDAIAAESLLARLKDLPDRLAS